MHNNSSPQLETFYRPKLLNKLTEIIHANDVPQLEKMLDAINANQPLDLRTGLIGAHCEVKDAHVEINIQFKNCVVAVAVKNSNLDILKLIDKKWNIALLGKGPYSYITYEINSIEVLEYLLEKQMVKLFGCDQSVRTLVRNALNSGNVTQLAYFFNGENREIYYQYLSEYICRGRLPNLQTINYFIKLGLKQLVQHLDPVRVIQYAELDDIDEFFAIMQDPVLTSEELITVCKICDDSRIAKALYHHTKQRTSDQVDQMIKQWVTQRDITPEEAEAIRKIGKEVRDTKSSSNVSKSLAPEGPQESQDPQTAKIQLESMKDQLKNAMYEGNVDQVNGLLIPRNQVLIEYARSLLTENQSVFSALLILRW